MILDNTIREVGSDIKVPRNLSQKNSHVKSKGDEWQTRGWDKNQKSKMFQVYERVSFCFFWNKYNTIIQGSVRGEMRNLLFRISLNSKRNWKS